MLIIHENEIDFGHKHIAKFDPAYILSRCRSHKSGRSSLYIQVFNYYVNVTPRRYRVFKKSLTCCICKCEASLCVLDLKVNKRNRKPLNPSIAMFNFYGFNNFGELFMLTMDHIVPSSRGGKNGMYNLQTMCNLCNQEKGNSVEKKRKSKKK